MAKPKKVRVILDANPTQEDLDFATLIAPMISDYIIKRYGVSNTIYFYGSRAEGRGNENSDFDFAAFLHEKPAFTPDFHLTQCSDKMTIEHGNGKRIDVVCMIRQKGNDIPENMAKIKITEQII